MNSSYRIKPTRILTIAIAIVAAMLFWSCQSSAPTAAGSNSKVGLNLHLADWVVWYEGESAPLQKQQALAAITRVTIYVIGQSDTLARTTVDIDPGDEFFEAVLDVPAGNGRRIVVEAWDDCSAGCPEGQDEILQFRGVQPDVTIAPFGEQIVDVTLFPAPIAGERVVIISGSGSGQPASSRNQVPIALISAEPVSGLQFDLRFDQRLISPINLSLFKLAEFANLEWSTITAGAQQLLRVLIFDQANATQPAVFDPADLLQIEFEVLETAEPGDRSILSLQRIKAADAAGNSLRVLSIDGSFTVTGGS